MKSLFSATLLLLCLSSHLAAGDGLTGYIDKSGKMIIEPRYAIAFDFSEGLSGVAEPGKGLGYIDKEGNLKIANPQFEEISSFHDGLARVKSAGKWGFIDRSGKWIVEPQFEMASDFSEGLAVVAAPRQIFTGAKGEGKMAWGYIDTNGKMVIPAHFFEANDFSEGLAMVRRTGGNTEVITDAFSTKFYKMEEVAGYIDKTGVMVIPPRFSKAMSFSEGLACVQFIGGEKSGYIDKSGKVVIELAHWAAEPSGGISVPAANFREGLAFVDTATGFVHVPKWGYIDTKGTVVMTPDANKASPFSEGLAVVGKGKLRFTYGYVDRTGKTVIPLQYKYAWPFAEGLAAVKTDKGWGYIDPTGKVVIEPKFDMAYPFKEGLARVVVRKPR